MAGSGVTPYGELTFDADGDPDIRQRDRLTERVREHDVTDLVVFAHGWNNDHSMASRLYERFFAPFPELAPGARLGYVGVLWPSMRFTDEPIPDFDAAGVVAAAAASVGLDSDTLRALNEVFPDRGQVIERLAHLLAEQPDDESAFDEFGRLVRRLTEDGARDEGGGHFTADLDEELEGLPAILADDTLAVCRAFADLLDESADAQLPQNGAGLRIPRPGRRWWNGARELLRQGTYYTMKRRAGTVGQRGLGPALGHLARQAPEVRVHLVGHSFGGRLVSFALRGLPADVRTVTSVTLLQAAFSHYAFTTSLPHKKGSGGVLRGQQKRVAGPVVCCYSRHDTALRLLYPLASRMAGDSSGLLGFDRRWGAMGHDGIQAVPGTKRLTLKNALRGGLPASGCVNVDAAQVVRRGGPPAGAHSDILHGELARVVLAAGRVRSAS
ncbi:serine-threonine protein kinase [Streptomyces sp. E11-3]